MQQLVTPATATPAAAPAAAAPPAGVPSHAEQMAERAARLAAERAARPDTEAGPRCTTAAGASSSFGGGGVRIHTLASTGGRTKAAASSSGAVATGVHGLADLPQSDDDDDDEPTCAFCGEPARPQFGAGGEFVGCEFVTCLISAHKACVKQHLPPGTRLARYTTCSRHEENFVSRRGDIARNCIAVTDFNNGRSRVAVVSSNKL